MDIFARLLFWSLQEVMGTIYGKDGVHISLACVHANELHVSQLCIAVRHARLTQLMLPVQGHLIWLLLACAESCLPHRGLETDRQHLSPNRLFRDLSPVTCFFPRCPSSFVFTTFQILLFMLFWTLPPSKSISSCAMWIHTQWKIAGARLCVCPHTMSASDPLAP